MGSSGFFKGEKKKPKKGKDKSIPFSAQGGTPAPTYNMPEVITKKKQQG